ncbi:MAG: 16S rRNA (guanine(527)-N(7))-methyltransferase RsmG [Puniceicoccales bacterium]|jgi:16S rRNA (guanine527-N7)-methyltransferase|nr:16S rRNA (guanine(527)-N(7))-methyltransferase RsmG [Puniceicoccales bacterium]
MSFFIGRSSANSNWDYSTLFPEFSVHTLSRLQQLCALVCEKNRIVNLISRKNIDQIVEAHLLPSLAILKKFSFTERATILDVGTGGGFPGIPLAIATPHAHFTLVDSIEKKIRAVEKFVTALELKNVTCTVDRAENLKKKYDYITGRAVTNIADFRRLVEPLRKPNGKILYLTGGDIMPENNVEIIDLFTLCQQLYCKTKKLLVIYPPTA